MPERELLARMEHTIPLGFVRDGHAPTPLPS
jgi:hypothetical protein